MVHKLRFIMVFTILITASNIFSQTIHRDDLQNVRISYNFNNYQDGKQNNFFTPTDWTLKFKKIDSDNSIWYDNYHDIQNNISPDLSNVWFKLYFEDDLEIPIADTIFIPTIQISQFGISKSIITYWNVINNDSIKYISAFAYDTKCNSVSKIEYHGKFPDSSNYLITSTNYAYHGDICDAYFFLKEVEKDYFVLFHSIVDERHMQNGIHNPPKLIMDNLKYNNYRIFKKNEFKQLNPIKVNIVNPLELIIDSIKIEPIDIWELAKKHFNIEN